MPPPLGWVMFVVTWSLAPCRVLMSWMDSLYSRWRLLPGARLLEVFFPPGVCCRCYFGNMWSPAAKNFSVCLGEALSPSMLAWCFGYQTCALLASACSRTAALLGLCLPGWGSLSMSRLYVYFGFLQVWFGFHWVYLCGVCSPFVFSKQLLWISIAWVRLSPHLLGLPVVYSVAALLGCS
jgi:hypothetical protein